MTSTCVYVRSDEKFVQSYRVGTVEIPGLSIVFGFSAQDQAVTQMEQLRDELQRQITAILENRPATPPAEPPADFYPTSPEPDSVVVTIPPVEESDIPF